MLLYAAIHLLLRLRGKLYTTNWYLCCTQILAPIGLIALIFGWLTTEMGRQPWVVYGLLRTAQAVSPVPLVDVIISFSLIIIAYGIIFGIIYFLYLLKTIRSGPISHLPVETQPFAYLDTHKLQEQ